MTGHPGLQPERTLLAWRRTLLAVGVGALVAIRILPPELGLWALVVGALGLIVAGGLWVLAGRRLGALLRRGAAMEADRLDGGLPLTLAALVSAGGLLGLAYVILR